MSARVSFERYPFAPTEQEGAFYFPTDNGCEYTLELSKASDKLSGSDLLENFGKVYEISFDGTCEADVYDPVVRNTLIYILIINILSRGDSSVFFYVCDNLDGKGDLRSRLFDFWYLAIIKEIPDLMKFNYVLPGYNHGEVYHVTLLINSSHPNFEEYHNTFESALTENFSKR